MPIHVDKQRRTGAVRASAGALRYAALSRSRRPSRTDIKIHTFAQNLVTHYKVRDSYLLNSYD